MPRSRQVRAHAGGKNDGRWEAEGDDQYKTKRYEAKCTMAWRSMREPRYRVGDAGPELTEVDDLLGDWDFAPIHLLNCPSI